MRRNTEGAQQALPRGRDRLVDTDMRWLSQWVLITVQVVYIRLRESAPAGGTCSFFFFFI